MICSSDPAVAVLGGVLKWSGAWWTGEMVPGAWWSGEMVHGGLV